jgi:cytosine deaminase
MFDFVVRQARLGPGPLVDIGIRDGLIRAVEQTLPEGPWPVLAAGGQLLIRGYVDPHMHLDKALLAERAANQSGTLSEAIDLARSAKQNANRADIAARAYAAAQMAIQNGVRAIRTHVDIDPVTGLEGFRAVADVREELKAQVAIQIVAFPQDGFGPDDEVLALMRQALAEGADLVGGIPARDADPLRHIDLLCRLARGYAVPVDMHVDESDDPADFTLPLVIDRVRHYGLQGRCTVGHLCSLAAVPDSKRRRPSLRQRRVAFR